MSRTIQEIALTAFKNIMEAGSWSQRYEAKRIARSALAEINSILEEERRATMDRYNYLGMPSQHAEEPRFWLVWGENTTITRVKHLDRDQAVSEASRLAQMRPGQKFYVVAGTAFVQYIEPKPEPKSGLVYSWMTKAGVP